MKEFSSDGVDGLSPEQAKVLDALCDRFEAAWRGDRPRIGDFLADVDAAIHPVLCRELIRLDVFYRQKAGERPKPEEYKSWLSAETGGGTDISFGTNAEVRDYSPPTAPGVTEADEEEFPLAGTFVGEYELLAEVARGGMGVVYRARQVALKRTVALKMIRSDVGADPGRMVRFQTEAEAVARLSHPNIVQIFEVGRHEGQPFLSLEFMAGGSLQNRLAGTPLPFREAAELLKTLAAATQYAHTKGIVHRDLKPANILLQKDEGRSIKDEEIRPPQDSSVHSPLSIIPKISDFGLAKQLDAENGQTCTGVSLGTPSYMAPEQAEGRVEEVGPPTDVYGLGAVLYECLSRPALHSKPPHRSETVRQVSSLDPVPPSRLQPQIPRDLEIVCLHCLEKDPRRRYASAAAVEHDLQRFLDGQPIKARPTPLWERSGKWARRRPLAAASSVIAAASLLGVVIMWVIFTVRLDEARRLAENNASEREQQRLLAEENRDKTLQVVDRFLTRVGETKLADNPELGELRKALLADALEFSKSFLSQKENPDPAIRREAAHAAQRTYRIYNMLGLSNEQYKDTQLAIDLLSKLSAEFPEDPGYRNDLASSLNALGVWYLTNGPTTDRLQHAEAHLLEALALRAELARQYPDKPAFGAALARTHSSLGTVCRRTGTRQAEAEHHYQVALDSLHTIVNEQPTVEFRSELESLDNRVANFYYSIANIAGAEKCWSEAFQLAELNLCDRPNDQLTGTPRKPANSWVLP